MLVFGSAQKISVAIVSCCNSQANSFMFVICIELLSLFGSGQKPSAEMGEAYNKIQTF